MFRAEEIFFQGKVLLLEKRNSRSSIFSKMFVAN